MSESVSDIFRILIKIPVIIVISYLIFNAFLFGVSYFKLLGASYTVMQVAMENNYIPDNERDAIEDYLDELSGKAKGNAESCLRDVKIYYAKKNPDGSLSETTSLPRVQYGEEVTVGVKGTFIPVIPGRTTMNGGNVRGFSATDATKYSGMPSVTTSDTNFKKISTAKSKSWGNTIVISYTVPGLKYYPDLS